MTSDGALLCLRDLRLKGSVCVFYLVLVFIICRFCLELEFNAQSVQIIMMCVDLKHWTLFLWIFLCPQPVRAN